MTYEEGYAAGQEDAKIEHEALRRKCLELEAAITKVIKFSTFMIEKTGSDPRVTGKIAALAYGMFIQEAFE